MPDKCSERYHHDGKDNESFYVCSICECPLSTHFYFIHCPLLDDELICSDCCQNDVEKDEIIKTFKDLGKEYTRESIDAACKVCGNRCVKTSEIILPCEVKDEEKK